MINTNNIKNLKEIFELQKRNIDNLNYELNNQGYFFNFIKWCFNGNRQTQRIQLYKENLNILEDYEYKKYKQLLENNNHIQKYIDKTYNKNENFPELNKYQHEYMKKFIDYPDKFNDTVAYNTKIPCKDFNSKLMSDYLKKNIKNPYILKHTIINCYDIYHRYPRYPSFFTDENEYDIYRREGIFPGKRENTIHINKIIK